MNGENFEHWMVTQLLPNLEEPSAVAVDSSLSQCPSGETFNTELEKG
jgi:hypothetical protein